METTFYKANKLLLIEKPSFLRIPSAYVLESPSEPAKSTRWRWDYLVVKGGDFYLVSIDNYKITCDLDENSFIFVSPKCLYSSPYVLK